ncbi:hypothetical protein M9458_052984, partial [Cirrhinus mrigala]
SSHRRSASAQRRNDRPISPKSHRLSNPSRYPRSSAHTQTLAASLCLVFSLNVSVRLSGSSPVSSVGVIAAVVGTNRATQRRLLYARQQSGSRRRNHHPVL